MTKQGKSIFDSLEFWQKNGRNIEVVDEIKPGQWWVGYATYTEPDGKVIEADVEGIYLGFRTDCQIEVVNSWEELPEGAA